MRVAEFYLINEKGQEYSLMDEINNCLLTNVDGLGYKYSTQYEQLGNTFVAVLRKLEQGIINGQAKFRNYDNFKSFIDFLESSESLRFLYKMPFSDGTKKEYYKDTLIQNVPKGYIIDEDEKLVSTVTFECLSLWYEENTFIYKIEPQNDEIRWDFRWDSRFSDYNTRSVPYINKGHTEAVVKIEMDGYLENPKLELYVEGQLYQTIPFHVTIKQYEKLLYDSRENHFAIEKQNTDGTKSSLFNLDVVEFENDNVLRLPKNKSCEIRLTADNEVLNAQVIVYSQYKAV